MNVFSKFNVYETKSGSNKSTFTIKNLEHGFGITIGNSLRRVLLSNIPGTSVFAIKINNGAIKHEYDAIPTIKEDALNLAANLKNLIVKIDESVFSDETLANTKIEQWPVLKIRFSGKGTITGKDVFVPTGMELVNPSVYIASAENDNSKLDVDIYVNTGKGFVSYEANNELVSSIGIIPINSNYSPIVHVSYNVDEVKKSRVLFTDDLSMTIATNGIMSPSTALAYASRILQEHYNNIVIIDNSILNKKIIDSGASQAPSTNDVNVLSSPITELNLSIRSLNSLKRQGINTISQLIAMSINELKAIKNLGKKSASEIIKSLQDKGYVLK